jgi:hypothetical protein
MADWYLLHVVSGQWSVVSESGCEQRAFWLVCLEKEEATRAGGGECVESAYVLRGDWL